jgi:hypothetical protein
MKKTIILLTCICMAAMVSCNELRDMIPMQNENPNLGKLKNYSNQVILDWNNIAVEAMGGPTYPNALMSSRIHAMMHIAMHDALNAISPQYESYAYEGKKPAADPIAAVAAAAHAVLMDQLPDQEALLNQRLAETLDPVKDHMKKTFGIELGKAAAEAILFLREGDGADQDPIGTTDFSTEPGVYQVVPPLAIVFGEFWKDLPPFALNNPNQFRVPPFPALTSQQYADDFEEVKMIGEENSPIRTTDQSSAAKFWYEFSELGWNTIARVVAKDKKLDLMTTARLFALLNIATADSYIAGFDSKYYYNFWRPYTAIRAENQGNTTTVRDPDWVSAEVTPPVPDYPSTHSALGNAAAMVLAHVLGDDTEFTFFSSTAVPIDKSRSFNSFSQAANENANSRVWAGLHFRFACDQGQNLGDEVGLWVLATQLQPKK